MRVETDDICEECEHHKCRYCTEEDTWLLVHPAEQHTGVASDLGPSHRSLLVAPASTASSQAPELPDLVDFASKQISSSSLDTHEDDEEVVSPLLGGTEH